MTAHRRTREADAVVTGAGSGIGRAFALELSRRGGRVVCVDIDADAASATARELERAGGSAMSLRCDVSREDSVRAVADRAHAWLRRSPSLLVNNAGIGAGGHPIGETPLEDWRRTLDVNLWGVIYGCHVFVPAMRAARAGGVINVASAAGFTAAPGMAAYNVSKAGVVSLSETLFAELAATGVAVTVLCPTFVRTNIFDGELIEEASSRAARKVASIVGFSPERVARMTLGAHDRRKLYVVPQPDAKLLWRSKRLFPTPFARFSSLLGRLAPQSGR